MVLPQVPPPGALQSSGRIQGFGNFNPPELEEDNAKTLAKRTVSKLGDVVGEEVALTIQDFREKGAVGAVKDAVADAGDILIDGAASIFGWIRGDPAPEPEEDPEAAAEVSKVLANGPRGAAYGVSQASPTGGINAVWVMPEDADPATLAELVAQQNNQCPSNIQPYSPQSECPPHLGIQPYSPNGGVPPYGIQPYQPNSAPQLPSGIRIAPYQPNAPSGPGGFIPPYQPGGFQQPGAFQQQHAGFGGGGGYGLPAPAPAPAAASNVASVKSLVGKVAMGDMLAGPELAIRVLRQCEGASVTSKQLAEVIVERVRRLYLGLDGIDVDTALFQMLVLVDALFQQGTNLALEAAHLVKDEVSEEFLSLRCNAAFKSKAESMLTRIGLAGPATPEMEDLLGEMNTPAPAARADQHPAASAAKTSCDLLGGMDMDPVKPSAAVVVNSGGADLLDF